MKWNLWGMAPGDENVSKLQFFKLIVQRSLKYDIRSHNYFLHIIPYFISRSFSCLRSLCLTRKLVGERRRKVKFVQVDGYGSERGSIHDVK